MATITIDNIQLYYDIQGEGEPLLFINGLGGSTQDWQAQVDYFSKEYQVITFDIRGQGKSDAPPGPYSISLFAEDSAKLIQALEVGPVHVVGISMGGMIAFQMVVDFPNLVKSLVIVNSGAQVVFNKWRERFLFWQRKWIVRLMGMQRLGKFLSKHLLPGPEREKLRKGMTARWGKNNKKAYLDSLQAFIGWSVMDQLNEIDCPILVIAADQDYTPLSFKEEYVAKIPQARLVVMEGSRHLTPMEHPNQFNQVLIDFLSDV
ncbi:MAG: alpha/beta fold hydrolase [SAR324 cluster bacterium]|nr:alpha/beta fold hydrolase [SAR324 cluster bacterium]